MRFINFTIVILFFASCDFKTSKDYFVAAAELEQQQKYNEAIKLLDKAILKDKQFIGAYINRGADKSAINDFKGAIEDYEKVLLIDHQNTLALFNIGNNYKRLNNYKTAINYYDKALQTKPGNYTYVDLVPNDFVDLSAFDVPAQEIFFEKGIALYFVDSLKDSYTNLQRCIKKGYMIADCYYWIAFIYLRCGQNKAACDYF